MRNRIASVAIPVLLLLLAANGAFADTARNRKALDEFKHVVSSRYIYKDYKNVYWDALYAKYEYRILGSRTDDEFAVSLNELTKELKDLHFRVADSSNRYLPSDTRDLKANYNLEAIPQIVQNLTELSGSISIGRIDKVGYIMIKSWDVGDPAYYRTLAQELFRRLFQNTSGLIIDVRMNPGGYIVGAEAFARRFSSQRLLAAYHHSLDRTGNLVKTEYYLEGERDDYAKPVIVLMGNCSGSATEHFILQMQAVPRVRTMGDYTGGLTGVPVGYRLSNGVQISVPSMALMDLRNTYIEEYGIRPDESVRFVQNASDNVLVHAFKKLGAKVAAGQ